MIEIRQTEVFENWLARLRDDIARKHVGRRLARLQVDLFGDTRSVGGKVSSCASIMARATASVSPGRERRF